MKITAINGSPKPAGSVSAQIIGQMEKLLGCGIEAYQAVKLVRGETPDEAIAKIMESDILLFVFPLYVDSLPAPLIELLTRIESAASGRAASPMVYAIINCGFYESHQNALALDMITHFARRAGLPWGYGVGIGGGGMLPGMGENWAKGPVSGIYNALRDMAFAIREKDAGQNVLVVPGIPRFIYKAAAGSGMSREAKKNGVRNVRTRPYLEDNSL